MYVHHHTVGFGPERPRVTRLDGYLGHLSNVDRTTTYVTLSNDPNPGRGPGTGPRSYIGGTVNVRSSTIDIHGFRLPFRPGDVRYPEPAHVRLARGESLHDPRLQCAVLWDR